MVIRLIRDSRSCCLYYTYFMLLYPAIISNVLCCCSTCCSVPSDAGCPAFVQLYTVVCRLYGKLSTSFSKALWKTYIGELRKKIPSPTPDSRLPSRLASASQHRVFLSLSNYVLRMRGTTKLKDKVPARAAHARCGGLGCCLAAWGELMRPCGQKNPGRFAQRVRRGQCP
jgi:hypothetical protein